MTIPRFDKFKKKLLTNKKKILHFLRSSMWFIFGAIIAYMFVNGSLEELLNQHWLLLKIFFVTILILYHIFNGVILKKLKEDR